MRIISISNGSGGKTCTCTWVNEEGNEDINVFSSIYLEYPKKLDSKFEKFYDNYQLYLLNYKKFSNVKFNNLFDFSKVMTIEELNFKIGEDIKILKLLPEYYKYK